MGLWEGFHEFFNRFIIRAFDLGKPDLFTVWIVVGFRTADF